MTHKYESLNSVLGGIVASGKPIEIGLVGARGYSGVELVKILAAHPAANLSVCFTSDASGKDFSVTDELLWSEHSSVGKPAPVSLPLSKKGELTKKLDVVFLATPAEVSMELAPQFLKDGTHVIDLSGAYRLEASLYPEWYGFSHTDLEGLAKANYGLVPFNETVAAATKKNENGSAVLVANPGCFVTSVVLPLIPLLREKVILADTLVIDAKSGTTGAGKKASEALLFSEVEGDCMPYKIGKHQHYPEIQKALKDFSGVSVTPFFTTQLLATRTGILASIYAKMPKGKTVHDVADAFRHAFEAYPLVRFAYAKEAKAKNLLSLRKVSGTPYTNLVYEVVELADGTGQLYLHSTIDNLWKGAASQAVENLNRLYKLPVHTGLIS